MALEQVLLVPDHQRIQALDVSDYRKAELEDLNLNDQELDDLEERIAQAKQESKMVIAKNIRQCSWAITNVAIVLPTVAYLKHDPLTFQVASLMVGILLLLITALINLCCKEYEKEKMDEVACNWIRNNRPDANPNPIQI